MWMRVGIVYGNAVDNCIFSRFCRLVAPAVSLSNWISKETYTHYWRAENMYVRALQPSSPPLRTCNNISLHRFTHTHAPLGRWWISAWLVWLMWGRGCCCQSCWRVCYEQIAARNLNFKFHSWTKLWDLWGSFSLQRTTRIGGAGLWVRACYENFFFAQIFVCDFVWLKIELVVITIYRFGEVELPFREVDSKSWIVRMTNTLLDVQFWRFGKLYTVPAIC